jgi:hypothetical protein
VRGERASNQTRASRRTDVHLFGHETQHVEASLCSADSYPGTPAMSRAVGARVACIWPFIDRLVRRAGEGLCVRRFICSVILRR